jgi:hypothetical protein
MKILYSIRGVNYERVVQKLENVGTLCGYFLKATVQKILELS